MQPMVHIEAEAGLYGLFSTLELISMVISLLSFHLSADYPFTALAIQCTPSKDTTDRRYTSAANLTYYT